MRLENMELVPMIRIPTRRRGLTGVVRCTGARVPVANFLRILDMYGYRVPGAQSYANSHDRTILSP